MMTMDQLVQALAQLLPLATIDTDNEGQIIIYTGLSWCKEERFWYKAPKTTPHKTEGGA